MLPRAIASTCSSGRVRYSDVGKRALPSRRATRTIPRASWLHAALVEVLIAQRIRAGLRQRDVAARIGKPQSAIARIELGQRRVDVVEFVQLAMVIGFDPARVLSHIVRAHGATRERIVLSKKHGG